MGRIHFTITLTSDAEPASGFGTELIDALLPRQVNGQVILPSTHIKGLIRENLENQPDEIVSLETIAELFGKEGDTAALFHIDDAVAPENATVMTITRTRLNAFGIAEQGALRTSEAVAAGTEFAGSIRTHPHLSNAYEDLLKLGLLSLFAVGGSRNRGAGACFVTLGEESGTPGSVLKSLARVDFNMTPATVSVHEPEIAIVDEPVTLKLVSGQPILFASLKRPL